MHAPSNGAWAIVGSIQFAFGAVFLLLISLAVTERGATQWAMGIAAPLVFFVSPVLDRVTRHQLWYGWATLCASAVFVVLAGYEAVQSLSYANGADLGGATFNGLGAGLGGVALKRTVSLVWSRRSLTPHA